MFRRAIQLFRRYARWHEDLEAPGFALSDEGSGEAMGQVERVHLTRGLIRVSGWCRTRTLDLVIGGTSHAGQPTLSRLDVSAAHDLDPVQPYGFVVEGAYDGAAACHLVLNGPTRPHVFPIAMPSARARRRARLRVGQAFVRDVWRIAPVILRWLVTRDDALRAPIKRGLRFEEPGAWALRFDPAVLPSAKTEAVSDRGESAAPITIVLPVFNAFELLQEALSRVLSHTDLPWHLVMIEDGSTDPRVRPFLRDWAAEHAQGQGEGQGDAPRITLIEHDDNLGFIRAVNTGLEAAAGRAGHVVLLNSDALVPQGWASRLLAPMLADDSVASVTPMSNDAEIFTVPAICQRGALARGMADAIDRVAQTLPPGPPGTTRAEAPTGVGFCMAMNRRFLDKVPLLDTYFGRGYGEEVDWCRRIAALGGRHLGIATLFVEHRGGSSFGSAAKQALVLKNNAIISERYPGYDTMVQDFIQTDPLVSARVVLGLAWAQAQVGAQVGARVGSDGAVPIYLGHTMGGGAETYLQGRIAADIAAGGAAVTLRVGGPLPWLLGVHGPGGVTQVALDDTGVLSRLLAPLTRRRIIYSNGVGHEDPVTLPSVLTRLKRGPQDRIEVLLHDFLPLSPSYTLLDAKGRYRGVPAMDNADPAHQSERADGTPVPLSEWRTAWGGLLAGADRIVAFSDNSRDLLQTAYPEAADACVVAPHSPDLTGIARVRPPAQGARPVIGVLGNIGYQKGAGLLQDLARHLGQSGAADLVVVGNIDPAYHLPPPARVHGSYQVEHVPNLAARYGITCWLIPSVWPETFSYTTHEALATGLPVWAFDLGAQGDTVRAAAARTGQGGVIPLDMQGKPDVDDLVTRMTAPAAGAARAGRG
ncbi:glycosyltransferase [Tateyamaria omphalii]|uniref:Glycosyltransferase 2-like domain-containing protein n=1 Tax=Tateyamaria omphalii TaxID=299262 RepID=A0A1P8N219_9RHOB|nr:glycosyltransferase [Tateyamaria omphalii]APX14363.1 hypothetical protein BWR18_21230 [Tateyamaria omphalii]